MKNLGGALQNPKQGSDPTLHSLQNGNPSTFFCPLVLVVPSFWLYKMLNLGRIFAFCPCLTPACWHWLLTQNKDVFCLHFGIFWPPWYLHRLWSPSFRRPFNGVNTKEATTEKWEMLGVCWVNEKNMFAFCCASCGYDLRITGNMPEFFWKKSQIECKRVRRFQPKKNWTVLTYFHLFVFGLEGSLQNPKPGSLNKLHPLQNPCSLQNPNQGSLQRTLKKIPFKPSRKS